jgi:hypothetical protein
MRLAREKVRRLAEERGFTMTEALRRARVSRNAFYHLARQATVIPQSVHALGSILGVPPAALLEAAAPAPERADALLAEARAIHARHRRSSFDNIWHTLWLLEAAPAERLRRSLIRGRATALHR